MYRGTRTKLGNRAAEHLYGYSASEALGRNILGFIVEERDFNEANEIVRRNTLGEIWTGQSRSGISTEDDFKS